MTGYYLLDHPNPNCPDRGDGRYWGYAEMAQPPIWITVHTTESFADREAGKRIGRDKPAPPADQPGGGKTKAPR